MPQEAIAYWEARHASNAVYAYGKLYGNRVVNGLDEKIQKLLIAAIIWHAPELNAQGVANCSWSMAKQGLIHHDVVFLLREAAVHTSHEMDAQAVANTSWAFATMKQPLGALQEPLMHAPLCTHRTRWMHRQWPTLCGRLPP
jgi:hypothetical protein